MKKDEATKVEDQLSSLGTAKVLSPLPVVDNFIGFNCRFYALAGVTKWMHGKKELEKSPLPARKMDIAGYQKGDNKSSLRQLAKRIHHSAVGEVYNIEDLAAIAEENEGVTATSIVCNDVQTYISRITQAIDADHAPVVFFDVDLATALPGKFAGENEHAAVVVGYEVDAKQHTTFKLAHWGKYVDCDAAALYESSMQLLKVRTGEEQYCKIRSRSDSFFGHSGWEPVSIFKKYSDNDDRIEDVKEATSSTSHDGYAGKILLLTKQNRYNLRHQI